MALTITYNTTLVNAGYVYRTTGGGVTFSANLAGTTVFDYLTDTAVNNDCIYFGKTTTSNLSWADILLNIGTALVGGTGVWEYSSGATSWSTIPMMVDGTNGLRTAGAVRLQFAYPVNWRAVAVNGVTNPWIRFRLTGGTVTEGGANSTTTPRIGDGRVNVSGTTVGSPATLNDIYTYMLANYSYTTPIKNANYYDFRWFSVSFDSPTLSTNEVLEIHFDMNGTNNVRGLWNFDYWTTGVLVGTNHGKQGSKIVINGVTNSYPCTFTVNQKSYGATYFSNPNKNAGYPNFNGTFYDCTLQLAPGAVGIGDIQNCTFETGFGFIASSWATIAQNPFLNNKFIIMSSAAWSVYGVSFDIIKPDITFDTGTKYLLGSQQNSGSGLVWNFVDPIAALPTNSTTNKPMNNPRGTDSDIANVFFYDASAGTYTDITTACADATANDVSLNGDVGDCWYFNILTATTSLHHPSFTMTSATNDYVYEWEYYKTSAFRSFTYKWDETSNLSQTGVVWMERAISDITSTTINGVAGFWYRLRIVTKGTTTNTATQIRRRSRPGVCDWKLNYQNSINYTAKNSVGAALAGVELAVYDTTGVKQFSGTTGVLGTIAAGNVTTNKYYFDPLDATRDTTMDTVEVLYNPFTFVCRKYGYLPQNISTTISAPQIPVFTFLTNANVVASQATAHAYTGITVNGATNTITIDADHTMQEVYDYCEDWYSLTANMGYNEPFVTTDGQNFTSTYDLVLNNCALTGTGRISIVVNTVTYIGTATSTLDIVAVDGTHTNIKLAGIVAGSRIQLYDTTSSTELYNGIVAGTTLTLPITWTTNHSIRVRAMYVSGATTAYKWFTYTGTLENTGFSLTLTQVENTIYEEPNIDGSTVTECAISGTTVRIYVDDPDNTTTGQRIYNWYQYYLFTEAGIREQDGNYINAIDSTHYIFDNTMKIINQDTVNPLNITGANITPVSGAATNIFDLTNGASICLNFNRVEGFAYSSGSGLSPEEHNALIDQKATIDTNLDAKVSTVKPSYIIDGEIIC